MIRTDSVRSRLNELPPRSPQRDRLIAIDPARHGDFVAGFEPLDRNGGRLYHAGVVEVVGDRRIEHVAESKLYVRPGDAMRDAERLAISMHVASTSDEPAPVKFPPLHERGQKIEMPATPNLKSVALSTIEEETENVCLTSPKS